MIIRTERWILRPFLESDAQDVYEYLHEPAVNCFVNMKLDTVENAKSEMIKRVSETEYYFAITLKETEKWLAKYTHRATRDIRTAFYFALEQVIAALSSFGIHKVFTVGCFALTNSETK